MAQDGPSRDRSDKTSRIAREASGDLPVVAFDFDGTLTVRDSFTAFLKWRAGSVRYAVGAVRLAPAAIAYLFHRDRGRIKAQAVREFLRGVPRATLEADARRFADGHAASLLRPDALETWRSWRDKPVRLVIVTASPDVVVGPFARDLAADDLLGTQLAYDAEDRVTGAFLTPNCRGPEKMVRLKARFGPDLQLEAAYGDTSGDREMLAAAEIRGFKVFKAQP
jgi:phosphatidylglycerophosphatase C